MQAFDSVAKDMAEDQRQQERSNHLAAEAEAERMRDAEDTRNAAAELHGRFEAQRVMEQAGIPMAEDGLPDFSEDAASRIVPPGGAGHATEVEIPDPARLSQLDGSTREGLPSDNTQASDQVGEHEQQQDDPQNQEQAQQTYDDADDLAVTAGQLLESVADNRSAKFQNSKFLELMRKLRDKEARVEGDQIVDVNEVSQLSNNTVPANEAGGGQDQQHNRVLPLDLAGLRHGRTLLFDDFVTCFGVPPATGERYLNGAISPIP